MGGPYRQHEHAPKVSIAERGRSSGGMLAFAAVAMFLALTFATTSRVTVSCARVRANTVMPTPLVSCYVEQASAWQHRSRTQLLRDPRHVRVESLGGLQRVTVDGQFLLDSELDARTLEQLASTTAVLGYGDYHLGHAGGTILDLRVLLTGFGAAFVLLMLARRRHVVALDRESEELHVTNVIGFIPWSNRRASVRSGDRVVARVDGNTAHLVIVGARRPIVLLESDARGGALERLAARVNELLPKGVED